MARRMIAASPKKKRKKVATRRKNKIGPIKKKLWKAFSLYVKLSWSHQGTYCTCYTCDANIKIGTSNCHAGHWLSQNAYPVHRYTEDNVRPQCMRCNRHLEGNGEVFRRRLESELGIDRLEEIYNTRTDTYKRDQAYYEEQLAHYLNQVEQQQARLGLLVRPDLQEQE